MKKVELPVDKSDFPTLNHKVMLSSCSQSAPPQAVFDAIDAYKQSLIEDGMDWTTWIDKVENSKRKFAELINAEPDEIAVLSSVSDAVSSVVNSLTFEQDEEICVTEIDFPNIGQASLSLNLRKNVPVKFIPASNQTVSLDDFKSHINENTKITFVSHVNYYNGHIQDIESISRITKKNGSLLFVDAYQSAGCVPIDVKEMGIDILVTGLQKFLMGVPGITFLYMDGDLADRLIPAVTGWFSQRDPFAFDIKSTDYADKTRRFNTGTPPIINAYAAEKALEYILNIGVDTIKTYIDELSEFAISYAKSNGLSVASPKNINEKASTTAIHVENADEIEEKMKEKGIIVSARKDVIRIAPHVYNTQNDIKIAIDTLKQLIKNQV